MNLLLLVLGILNGGDNHGALVWHEDSTWLLGRVSKGCVQTEEGGSYEETVSGDKEGVDHGLVDEEVAHPLTDNNVNLVDRELNVLNLTGVRKGEEVAK